MPVTLSTTAQRTPVDLSIAAPSVAGSVHTNADLSLSSTLDKSTGEYASYLFSFEETACEHGR